MGICRGGLYREAALFAGRYEPFGLGRWMNFRLRDHQFVVNHHPGRFLRKAAPPHVAEMEASLDAVALMLGDRLVWHLSGGLAIPATIGRFYRRHADIDVRVENCVLPELVKRAQGFGYLLFAHLGAIRLSHTRRVDRYRPLTTAEALTGRWKGLRLVRSRSDGTVIPIKRLQDSLDLHVYEIRKDVMTNLRNGRHVPAELLNGATYITGSGFRIRVVDLQFVLACKKYYFSAADRLDKRMISGCPPGGMPEGVGRAPAS